MPRFKRTIKSKFQSVYGKIILFTCSFQGKYKKDNGADEIPKNGQVMRPIKKAIFENKDDE